MIYRLTQLYESLSGHDLVQVLKTQVKRRPIQVVEDTMVTDLLTRDGQVVGAVGLDLVRGEFEESSWRAFWLTAIEDRSPAALSGELGMTTAAIRQAKSRVLRRIKEELGELLA